MTLKNVFDKDTFVIDGKEYTDQELQAMSLDDLETLKMLINKKVSGLSIAIKEKKMDYASGGKGASKDWTMRHMLARSINQRVLTYVNYLIKRRYDSERKISDCFMSEAKKYLRPVDYDCILTKAHKAHEERGIV